VILKETFLCYTHVFLDLKFGVSGKIVQNLSLSLKEFIFVFIWGVMFTYVRLYIATGMDYIYPVINAVPTPGLYFISLSLRSITSEKIIIFK